MEIPQGEVRIRINVPINQPQIGTVFIDNIEQGRYDLTQTYLLPVGTHQFRIEQGQWHDHEEFTIQENQITIVSVDWR